MPITKEENSPFTYKSKIDDSTVTFTPKKNAIKELTMWGIGKSTILISRVLLFVYKLIENSTRSLTKPLTAFDVIKNINMEGFSILEKRLNENIEGIKKQPEKIKVFKDEYGNDRYFSTDEFIIQFKEDIDKALAKKKLEETGSSIKVSDNRISGLYIAKKPSDKGLFEIIRFFNDDKNVVFCEPSEYGIDDQLSSIPSICDISDKKKFWALQCIEANEAWKEEIGKEHVIISIIDTGVDLNHENLKPNLLDRGNEDWDFVDSDFEPSDEDELYYHGTFIAGIAAAADCVTEGTVGVCPNAKIMPLRVQLGATSKNDLNRYFDRFEAISFVAEKAKSDKNKRYILSCSWKISGDSKYIFKAIKHAVENGVLVIFAAGNDNKNLKKKPLFPAGYPEVLTVSATDQNDKKWSSSWNYGSNYGPGVDVCAPGDKVWSTIGNNGYDFNSGTSFAVPYVAGLAALLWSINPSLSNYDIRDVIENTCDEINDRKYKSLLGHGRINARRAVQQVSKMRLTDVERIINVWDIDI